ncbi:MAG: hypothetical protein ACRDWV_11140, partial [Acidimicrobiales bacterium]
MTWVSWFGFALGIVVLVAMAVSVLRVLLVPRASRSRLARAVLEAVRRAFRRAAGLAESYASKDRR